MGGGTIRSDYIKPTAFAKLHLLMQYENILAVEVSLETGARIGDVVALRKDCLKGRTLRYTAQKTGKEDIKVISADLANRLRRNACGVWLFPSERSKSGHRTRQAVWKDIKQASKALGLKGNISPHSARKTYAVVDYHKNGLKATQEDLQHDRIDTTLIYALSDTLAPKDGAPKDGENKRSAEFAELVANRVVEKLLITPSLHIQVCKPSRDQQGKS